MGNDKPLYLLGLSPAGLSKQSAGRLLESALRSNHRHYNICGHNGQTGVPPSLYATWASVWSSSESTNRRRSLTPHHIRLSVVISARRFLPPICEVSWPTKVSTGLCNKSTESGSCTRGCLHYSKHKCRGKQASLHVELNRSHFEPLGWQNLPVTSQKSLALRMDWFHAMTFKLAHQWHPRARRCMERCRSENSLQAQ